MSEDMTIPSVDKIIELLSIVQTIESCDQAILQYAEMGISGTVHDVEHRKMRGDAMRRFEELRS